MGKPCPASKKHLFDKSKSLPDSEVKIKEEPSDSDESDIFEAVPPRRTARSSKPVLKKTKYTEEKSSEDEDSKSEESEEDEESDDSLPKKGKGSGKAKTPVKKPTVKAPARSTASTTRSSVSSSSKNGTPASNSGSSGKKRPLNGASNQGNKSKKSKYSDGEDDDDQYEDVDDDEENVSDEEEESDDEDSGKNKKKKPAPKSKAGAKKTPNSAAAKKAKEILDKEDNDDEEVDYESLVLDDDEPNELANWKAPNYKDKEWFKENCLICQYCKKKYKHTGEALKCFHKHKDRLRCYMCFYIIKGGKNGTKRLFRHYQRHHEKGDKPNSNKCPHCNEPFPFKSTSCHIISTHFREALGLPERPVPSENGDGKATENGKEDKEKGKSNGFKVQPKKKISLNNSKKKSRKDSEDDESDEEISEEEEEEEDEEEAGSESEGEEEEEEDSD